jgi:hypothetical protein
MSDLDVDCNLRYLEDRGRGRMRRLHLCLHLRSRRQLRQGHQAFAWQRTGFGIDAALSGNSNECHSGHALQETITGDQGVTKPQVHDLPSGDVTIGSPDVNIISNQSGAQDFPDVGATTTGPNAKPKFGADQYTNPNATDLLIEKNGGHIKWWDNPDQSKDGNAEAATWVFRYFSFVQGSSAANSCACVYDITVNWPSGGAATTAWAEQQASSRNFHF